MIRYGKRFSKSAIKTYIACPRAYEYKYEMGLEGEADLRSSVAGRAAHKVIWAMHRTGNFEPDMRKWFMKAFEQELRASVGEIRWPKNPDVVKQEIADEYVRMLEGYANDQRNRDCRLLLNEAMFHVELTSARRGAARYPFDGTIDQMRLLPDGRTALVDIKSGAGSRSEMDLMFSPELAIYAYALWKGEFQGVGQEWKPRLPDLIGFWRLRDYIPYQQNQYMAFISTGRKVKDLVTGRMKNETAPNPRYERGYKKGQLRGPAWYYREIDESDVLAMLDDVLMYCRSIRLGIFPRREGESGYCQNLCEYRTYCRMDHEVRRAAYSRSLSTGRKKRKII